MNKVLSIFVVAGIVFGAEVNPRTQVIIPAQTPISVRLIDTIDSSKSAEGEMFNATVAEPVRVGNRVVVQRGAMARLKLVNLDQSGKFKGSTEIGVRLVSLNVNGRDQRVSTGEVTKVSGSQGKNTALKTGIGAGIGAAIGAIAGGGKGAAIGAGAGGAAGAGSQIFTKGKKVQIPTESLLTFVLTRDALN